MHIRSWSAFGWMCVFFLAVYWAIDPYLRSLSHVRLLITLCIIAFIGGFVFHPYRFD